MAIERMNYFKGEFLHEEDFKIEQKYHIDMRRRHNWRLHTRGIVYGLTVAPGTGKVIIQPGMAIDGEGREIVLETEKEVLITSSAKIAIKYKEELTHDSSETGISGKKSWTESAEIVVGTATDAIVIADVTNVNTSPVTLDPAFKPQYSGPAVMGDLVIEGDLTVKGTATTVNTETLEVEDNIIRVNKYAPQATPKNVNGGLEVYRGGTAPNAQIIWDEGVDKWKMGIDGTLVDILDSSHKHSSLSTPAGTQALSVDAAGNVGIGTTGPKAKLHTVGDLVLGLDENNKKFIFHSRTNGNGDFLQITHDKTDGGWDWNQGITLKRGGNVGIGTTGPQDKLDIAGSLRVLTGSNPIRFTSAWSGFPDAVTNQAEISNDTVAYKTLMIVGNKSAGLGRRVSVWDRLEVNGKIKVAETIGTNGYDPVTGLPTGWGGGVHTWDVAAHGTGRAVNGWQTGGWDLAEKFDKHDSSLESGDVVVADPNEPERLIKSTSPYQGTLLGVISEKPGFLLGVSWEDPKNPIALAIAGRVPVKVNIEGGNIKIGDCLTSSSEPGYAMKARESGRVIGIALESFSKEKGDKGKIVVFINPHMKGQE